MQQGLFDTAKTAKFTGVVSKILFQNESNGYFVISVYSEELLKDIAVTINQPNISEGVTYKFEGFHTNHPKYGDQFKAEFAQEVMPTSKEGLKLYLSSSFFPGIGPVMSERILNHFGDNVMDIFKNHIDRLLEVSGIAKKKLKALKEAWVKNSEINEIMICLRSWQISTLFATKIYEQYGNDCIKKIKENPYILAKDIHGIGFRQADAIAMNLGFDKSDFERIKACVFYVLEQTESEGHCYIFYEQIIDGVKKYISDIENYSKDIQKSLLVLSEEQVIKIEEKESKKRYYSKKLFFSESYCANKLIELLSSEKKNNIEWVEDENSKLSKEQNDAIKNIIKNGVSVLTGGPGCGKSFSLKSLIDILYENETSFILMAPTGRAAQRMTEVTGYEASTIHRALGWDHVNKAFKRNEQMQFEHDFIIIDETSMVDIKLASSLLKAIPETSRVLLVGDVDQLPPVGPGSFFKDVIDSGKIPVYKLTKIFRQKKESLIIKHAHEINHGIISNIKNPLIEPEAWKDKIDCLFIESGLDEGQNKSSHTKRNSLRYGVNIIDMILKLYTEIIPKYHGTNKEIQILIPMNVGDLGCLKINEVVRNVVNPKSEHKKEIIIGKGKLFREGDRVIQTDNNYDLGVFNGDIGKIESINPKTTELSVVYPTKTVLYKNSQILDLLLSFAISIHKSQGSEFPCVILPIMNHYYRMLERRLIYTALTRAKELAVFIGQTSALNTAIKNINYKKRQTSLQEMLNEVEDTPL